MFCHLKKELGKRNEKVKIKQESNERKRKKKEKKKKKKKGNIESNRKLRNCMIPDYFMAYSLQQIFLSASIKYPSSRKTTIVGFIAAIFLFRPNLTESFVRNLIMTIGTLEINAVNTFAVQTT